MQSENRKVQMDQKEKKGIRSANNNQTKYNNQRINLTLSPPLMNESSQIQRLKDKLGSIDEFVQGLNKRVVLTKVKVERFLNQSRAYQSSIDRQIVKEQNKKVTTQYKLKRQQIISLKQSDKLQSIKTTTINYQNLNLQQLILLLKSKDQQIKYLNINIQNLNKKLQYLNQNQQKPSQILIQPQYSIKIQTQTQVQVQSLKKNHKNLNKYLQIDTNKINQFYYEKSVKQQKQIQSITNLNKQNQTINPQFKLNDPVFKIPCLSPTMLQMKCIQKVQNQRRRKLRQLKKDVTATKIITNQIQNLAAGIQSSLNQQMLNNAQNPIKNRFIRKPMSPIFSSLYSNSKQKKDQNQQNHFIQTQASPIFMSQIDEEKKAPQKLNLPYFMSLKKKIKQTQKQ